MWFVVFLSLALFGGRVEAVPCAALTAEYYLKVKRAILGDATAQGWLDRISASDETVRAFEDDLISLYQLPAATRNWDALQERWEISRPHLEQILAYYSLDDLPRPTTLQRLERLNRALFLASDAPAARRYPFYRENLTRLSVPEMAEELKLAEREVRRDLSLLGLSIVEEFRKPRPPEGVSLYARLQALERGGKSPAEAARILGVGERAVEFFYHRREGNRGVGWRRVANFRGMDLAEEAILERLHAENRSVAECAAELNRLFETRAQDPDYRTEGSVMEKLMAMGLAEGSPRGSLDPIKTREFLYVNLWKSDAELAEALGVSETALRDFYIRYAIVRPGVRYGYPREKGRGTTDGSSVRARRRESEILEDLSAYLLLHPDGRGLRKDRKATYALAGRWAKDPKSRPADLPAHVVAYLDRLAKVPKRRSSADSARVIAEYLEKNPNGGGLKEADPAAYLWASRMAEVPPEKWPVGLPDSVKKYISSSGRRSAADIVKVIAEHLKTDPTGAGLARADQGAYEWASRMRRRGPDAYPAELPREVRAYIESLRTYRPRSE